MENLVYASDGSHKLVCKVCSKLPCGCPNKQKFIPSQTTLKVRVEKNGRGGKSVSVIHELPNDPEFFKKVAKQLKAYCGTGGTFKSGKIEIQGDHREKIKTFLEKLEFKVKFSGG